MHQNSHDIRSWFYFFCSFINLSLEGRLKKSLLFDFPFIPQLRSSKRIHIILAYLVCSCCLRLAGDQRLQEILDIVRSEPGHRLLLQELLDDFCCLAQGTAARVTESRTRMRPRVQFIQAESCKNITQSHITSYRRLHSHRRRLHDY